MSEHTASLAPNRTPNLIQAAIDHLGMEPTAAAAGEAASVGGEAAVTDAPAPGALSGLCTISRHGNTQSVPWAWLTVALVLKVI